MLEKKVFSGNIQRTIFSSQVALKFSPGNSLRWSCSHPASSSIANIVHREQVSLYSIEVVLTKVDLPKHSPLMTLLMTRRRCQTLRLIPTSSHLRSEAVRIAVGPAIDLKSCLGLSEIKARYPPKLQQVATVHRVPHVFRTFRCNISCSAPWQPECHRAGWQNIVVV